MNRLHITIKQIRIDPVAGRTELSFRLDATSASDSPISISFVASYADAMRLMDALRKLQAQHSIPIPPTARPSGKPKLVVVGKPKKKD